MPIEFFAGRQLSREELELPRRQIEKGFDHMGAVDDEIRAIVARNWPDLVSIYRKKTDVARSSRAARRQEAARRGPRRIRKR